MTLNGTSSQLAEIGTIEDVIVDNSSGVTATSDIEVISSLTLSDGELNLNNFLTPMVIMA